MKFEERLADAIRNHTNQLLQDAQLPSPERLAAALISSGDVADPNEHQADLQAIAARQDCEATAWVDEYVTTTENPAQQNTGFIAAIIDQEPDWEDDVPTWRRRVTNWQEVHRAQ